MLDWKLDINTYFGSQNAARETDTFPYERGFEPGAEQRKYAADITMFNNVSQ